MSDYIPHHDVWDHTLPKLPKVRKIVVGPLEGVLPFDGVHNPGSVSSTSHRTWFLYRTEANGWRPKEGVTESSAETACGHEVLIDADTYDVRFQPLRVEFHDEDGRRRTYTHDIMVTTRSGHRRLIFVRNETSLQKPRTRRDIEAIQKATPPSEADDMIVVDANDYTRQRRENLFRMHGFVFDPDD